MLREEPSTILQAQKTTRHPATIAAFLCAILLLLLLPVHAYFSAFTRDTPPWLQWMLYGLLSLIGVIGMIGVLVTWRKSHPLLRWLDLIRASTLPLTFSWFMFHSFLIQGGIVGGGRRAAERGYREKNQYARQTSELQ